MIDAAIYFWHRADNEAMLRAFSKRVQIRYHAKRFELDLKFADDNAGEGTESFGAVQEVYISDVYLRNLSLDLSAIRNVVDLGGNRGLFSVFAATFASRIVYVEANEKYKPILVHNMAINDFKNFAIENVFVGSDGFNAEDYKAVPQKTLRQIMTDNGLTVIDFLKVDIEGSEFSLFAVQDNCLADISHISMELHPKYGNVGDIVDILENNGFDVVVEGDMYLSASNRALSRYR
jgi:hypothetical protein